MEYAQTLAEADAKDQKIQCPPTTACGSCKFTATEDEMFQGFKSGLRECWKATLGYLDRDFEDPTVLKIWNYRHKSRLIREGTQLYWRPPAVRRTACVYAFLVRVTIRNPVLFRPAFGVAAAGNRQRQQRRIGKRSIPDGLQPFRKRDGGEVITPGKRFLPNALQPFRRHDGC